MLAKYFLRHRVGNTKRAKERAKINHIELLNQGTVGEELSFNV